MAMTQLTENTICPLSLSPLGSHESHRNLLETHESKSAMFISKIFHILSAIFIHRLCNVFRRILSFKILAEGVYKM